MYEPDVYEMLLAGYDWNPGVVALYDSGLTVFQTHLDFQLMSTRRLWQGRKKFKWLWFLPDDKCKQVEEAYHLGRGITQQIDFAGLEADRGDIEATMEEHGFDLGEKPRHDIGSRFHLVDSPRNFYRLIRSTQNHGWMLEFGLVHEKGKKVRYDPAKRIETLKAALATRDKLNGFFAWRISRTMVKST